jgi:hypothetical protein
VDSIGRRWGLIQDVIIMFLGLCMLVASWGTSLQGWVVCYAWSLFFYGIGVGGEVSAETYSQNTIYIPSSYGTGTHVFCFPVPNDCNRFYGECNWSWKNLNQR